jgi:hypothetical protein
MEFFNLPIPSFIDCSVLYCTEDVFCSVENVPYLYNVSHMCALPCKVWNTRDQAVSAFCVNWGAKKDTWVEGNLGDQ